MFVYSPAGRLKDKLIVPRQDEELVLAGAAVFDASADSSPRATVVLRGGVIEAVGAAGTPVSGQARHVELDGLTLLPALVDCHVHLSGRAPDAAPPIPPSHAGSARLYRAVRDANLMLDCGVTNARHLGGGDPEHVGGLQEAVASGLIAGPHIQSAGWPLSSSPEEPAPWMTALLRAFSRRPGVPSRRDAMRTWVRQVFARGADLIMINLSGDDSGEVSEGELKTVVEEVRRVGGRVACHAPTLRYAKMALRAHVHSLEGVPVEVDEELIDLLARSQTVWVPLLSGQRGAASRDGPAAGRVDDVLAAVGEVARRGGTVAAGTGWSGGGRPYRMTEELRLLAAAGLGPVGALRAATGTAAAAMGLGPRALVPGAPASLIAVDGDPIAEPSLLGDPGRTVRIVHGPPPKADFTWTTLLKPASMPSQA